MASLTPGVLLKLLQNVDNPTAKVAGDHRSALLQVIGIVPQDDVFDFDRKNKGFYLRVSDSVHSAYVSVSESDVDLILSDKIQLGQFVYVSRLDSGSPVPVLRGVKPVAKRRACVGEPKDLISSDSLQIRGNNRVDFSKKKEVKSKAQNGNNGRRLSLSNGKTGEGNNGRRLSFSNGKIGEGLETRRLSLDYSSRKAWDRSPAPTSKNAGSGSKPKEPSSPLCSTPVRSGRKASSEKDSVLRPPVCSGRKVSSDKDLVLKQPNSNMAPLKNKNVVVSEKLISKPIQKDLKSAFNCTVMPSHLHKVPIGVRRWSDSKISWDSVSPTLCDLGKEVACHRNVGFSTAAHALEEASVIESILQCLSVFAEICESAQKSTNPMVEQFLNFYQNIERSAAVVRTLIDPRSTDEKTQAHPRNAALWVEAALQTDLSKFSLYAKEDNRNTPDRESGCYVVLENRSEKVQMENRLPENKRSPKTHVEAVSNSTTKQPSGLKKRLPAPTTKKTSTGRVEWSQGDGLKDAANLAEKLLLVSRKWFLKYLEDSLNNGFGLKNGEEDSGAAIGLLGQLKRVNQWLSDAVQVGNGGDERVENVKNLLYRFLLDHVQKAGS